MLRGVAWLIEATWPLIDVPASWTWAVWNVAELPPVCGARYRRDDRRACAAAGAWPRRRLLVVIAAAAWRPAPLPEGAAHIAMLDVGQGLAVVVETRSHVLVYDAGPSFRSGSDAALLAIEPYLRHRGVRAIDLLVVSHDDADHAGGAASLLASFPVRARAASGEALGAAGVSVRRGAAGRGTASTSNGCTRARRPPAATTMVRACSVFVPESTGAADRRHRARRGTSCFAPHRLGRRPAGRAAPWQPLVVEPGFVETTRPRWALVSSGHGNRWRFPAAEVVRAGGMPDPRTGRSQTGAVEFELRAGAAIAAPRLARADSARSGSGRLSLAGARLRGRRRMQYDPRAFATGGQPAKCSKS